VTQPTHRQSPPDPIPADSVADVMVPDHREVEAISQLRRRGGDDSGNGGGLNGDLSGSTCSELKNVLLDLQAELVNANTSAKAGLLAAIHAVRARMARGGCR
jgi:hypothetical protein